MTKAGYQFLVLVMVMSTLFLNGCDNALGSSDSSDAEIATDLETLHELFGEHLTDADGTEVETASLEGKKIGIYFSGEWCPPCRDFTPILIETYQELRENNRPFAVVFVSSDSDEDAMFSYMQDYSMPWKAVPYPGTRRADLREKYEVTGIPTLIIIDAAGMTLSTDGRNEVYSAGAAAYDSW